MINYDIEYYYNLLRIHCATAKDISKVRWDFLGNILDHNIPITILDYGCGIGFFEAFRPKGVPIQLFTYDIMPVPQTGIPENIEFDVITLWDVLEHIPDFTSLAPLLAKTRFVALSLPIKPDGKRWEQWKHFKPGEHLHYYSEDLLVALFEKYDFKLVDSGTPECPPREDVWSFIFAKKDIA